MPSATAQAPWQTLRAKEAGEPVPARMGRSVSAARGGLSRTARFSSEGQKIGRFSRFWISGFAPEGGPR